jgi:hypothetical protein
MMNRVYRVLLTELPRTRPARTPGEQPGTSKRVIANKWIALFEFGTVATSISELFGPLEKPPLAALPFFLGC